jgi:pimeloyl-ACP methyl ester carboxylesterase
MISAEPVRHGRLELRDGRELAYAEFGDPDGRPMVLLHGNPGSRLICPEVDTTVSAGVRLVTFDRPGVGGSDPFPFHRLDDVADDLAELVDALEIGPCPLIGWSGGGPYALAASVRHPEHVTSVALVSASGRPDDPDVLAQHTPEIEDLLSRLRQGSDDAFAVVESRFAFYGDDPLGMVRRILAKEGHPDQQLMRSAVVQEALGAMWQEGARQGSRGVAAGWVALWALPWGFDAGDVSRPVTAWHGTEDDVVPYEQAERHVATIPGAHLHRIDGAGHLLALEHWPQILADR